MLRRYSTLAITTLIVVAVMAPSLGSAQIFPAPIVPQACAGKDAATACNLCQLAQLARNLTNFAIFFAVIMAAVLFAWSGIKYLTNMGNVNQAKQAREMLTNVFLGLLIVLCAWLLVNTFMSFLMGTVSSGGTDWRPWNQICTT